MDIGSFWITGGGFIINTTKFSETSTKRKAFLKLVFVLILSFNNVVPLFASPFYYPVSSSSSTRQLHSYNSPATKHSSTEFHPQPTKHKASTSSSFSTAAAVTNAPDQQFKVAAHEVPSGPNPESN
ncbi:hypothetical protein Patl1_25956 [Pistacia atlantica]|uniref:Uncharacterized protein n=1 Tax=Pistacia atlantica TaxID=434234 RepID=A0ACC1B1Q0_9ROSI|nr:hypothetical protein Patl1_25956 [Pistacia atlantica]